MNRDRLQRAFVELAEVMARLRQECPWDRAQTHRSLRRFLLEECYEVLDALDQDDPKALREELGDLLFQIWFHAELASEDAREGFELSAVLEGIIEKLVRRHPHVFADTVADDAATVIRNWDELKRKEKAAERTSVFDGLPPSLPPLLRSLAVQEKAASQGFDWPNRDGVVAKIREEVDEFLAEVPAGVAKDDIPPATRRRLEEELGDLLAVLVFHGRHLGISADDALRGANRRFESRFRRMEQLAATDAGRRLKGMTLDELEALWQQAKQDERT